MATKKLSEEQKVFIVAALARYASPSEVVKLVREEYGVEIARQSVRVYDPTTGEGKALSADLRELFFTTRREFRRQLTEIPVYHQSYRLYELTDLYRRAKADGNYVVAADFLKQAAQEVGGLFTNKRVFAFDPLTNAKKTFELLREEFRGQLDEAELLDMAASDNGVAVDELRAVVFGAQVPTIG